MVALFTVTAITQAATRTNWAFVAKNSFILNTCPGF